MFKNKGQYWIRTKHGDQIVLLLTIHFSRIAFVLPRKAVKLKWDQALQILLPETVKTFIIAHTLVLQRSTPIAINVI